MESISIYTALLGQKKLKERFVEDFRNLLMKSGGTPMTSGKLCFIKYSEIKNWSVRKIVDGEDMDDSDKALVDKIEYMLLYKQTDFESVIRMLYSFRNGPKSGIKVHSPDDNYEWTNKDGNEKHTTHNLKKDHFRFNWKRYTLSEVSVIKITQFVDTILKS